MLNNYRECSGKVTVNNGAASATIIAAPGAGKAIRLVSGIVNITVAAAAGGVVSIKDGSTIVMSFEATAVRSCPFTFSSENGFPITANTAVNVVAEGGATQATANVALVGYIVG